MPIWEEFLKFFSKSIKFLNCLFQHFFEGIIDLVGLYFLKEHIYFGNILINLHTIDSNKILQTFRIINFFQSNSNLSISFLQIILRYFNQTYSITILILMFSFLIVLFINFLQSYELCQQLLLYCNLFLLILMNIVIENCDFSRFLNFIR